MRDPRGIIKSRSTNNWCGKKPHCSNVTELCQLMDQNMATAMTLKNAYSKDRITLVRYEDVTSNPYRIMEKIFGFLGLDYPIGIDKHIAEHTGMLKNHGRTRIKGGGDGYNSNSAQNAFQWRTKLTKQDIDSIEKHCSAILDKLGYARYRNIKRNSDILAKSLSEIWT